MTLKTTENYAAMYSEMHARKGGKYFPGRGRGALADATLKALVAEKQPARVLDYGSGKGLQYTEGKIHERWGLTYPPICYDVGVPELTKRPEGKFGGVICTDMMEHIAEADVDAVLADIIGYADVGGFVFFHISTRASGNRGKNLPDGRDPHLTVQPAEWWDAKIAKARADRPDVTTAVQFGD